MALNLLCRLGLHRPEPDPVWNQGYYFSRCARCGADIVRTPSGRWHVPAGHKVVWKPRKPRGRRRGPERSIGD
jgi:hypothetical protein